MKARRTTWIGAGERFQKVRERKKLARKFRRVGERWPRATIVAGLTIQKFSPSMLLTSNRNGSS